MDRKQFQPLLPPGIVDEVITWDNNVDFWKDRLQGLADQLVAQGLIIRGADRQGIKCIQHAELDPVISHNVLG